jgi:hypothetical protein
MNREVLKQHLKNIGAIGLGTGLGLGASEGAIYGLEKAYQKLGKNPPPTWVPHAMRAAVIPALAMGAYAAHRGMRDESNYELEMARRRGLKQQEEESPKIVGGVPELEGM